ncbi:MAG: LLM class flavin-dependent oxidoreductase [Acidimicrobiia bacterium]|nr:LLM class flavin-dependent oxidoreductase [Acidimicrobiia bacterium]
MRYGIFDHMELRDTSLQQLYRERLQYVEAADQAGFWAYFKSEHHLTPLDGAPCPSVFLAAAAQRSERIRLIPLVYLLPFHHPLRLVEEISMLDNLCNGRLEVGVGRGIAPPEHEMWGLDPAPEAARARSEETLEAVRAGLTSERLTFHGEFWHFEDVPIELHPLQQPYPPLWYPGNVDIAGPRGFNTIVGGPAPVAAKAVARYRDLYQAADAGRTGVNPGIAPTVGCAARVFIGDDDASAEARARQAWAAYTHNITLLWIRAGFTTQQMPTDPSAGGDFDVACQRGLVVAGSASKVADYVQSYGEATGADLVMSSFCWGDIDHAEAMRSLERFADALGVAVPA